MNQKQRTILMFACAGVCAIVLAWQVGALTFVQNKWSERCLWSEQLCVMGNGINDRYVHSRFDSALKALEDGDKDAASKYIDEAIIELEKGL